MPGVYPIRTSRVPVTIQSGVYGTSNPAAQVRGGGVPLPSVRAVYPALSREHFDDAGLNRLQDKLNSALQTVHAIPFADGNLIPALSFTGGQTTAVNHGLGRAWAGYLVFTRLVVPAGARGTATLAAGTVTVTPGHSIVPNASPTAITVAYNTIGGTAGHLSVPQASRTTTAFVIQSDSSSDTSTVDWAISPPWPEDFVAVPSATTDATTINLTAPYTCTASLWVW